jgi:hypothetical protein
MREPMRYWGPDGGGVWREGRAGLGQLVAHRTPEDVHERGPVTAAGGTAIVTAAARLDNRDELLKTLDVPGPDRPTTADGALVALAYERWGAATPERLRGDWSYAAWHPSDRRLVLARDHYGLTALYWYRRGSTLAFASSVKGLLALPEVPHRLDELRFAQALVLCVGDGQPSMYEDVQRLPTARTLTFDHGGVRVREYWSLHDLPETRLGSDDEYVERLLDVLGHAVRARLRACGPVATTLSAGLDSAAVTAVAARELGDRPLTAYTGRPAYPEVAAEFPELLVDEWPGARLVAARWPGIRHVAVRGEHVSPLAAIERSLWMHDEPEHAVPNLPWVTALLDRAREDGHVALLTGSDGQRDPLVAGDDRGLLTAIARGDVADALRALRHARASGRGGWRGAAWRGLVLPIRRLVAAERMRRDPARQPGCRLEPDRGGLRRPDRRARTPQDHRVGSRPARERRRGSDGSPTCSPAGSRSRPGGTSAARRRGSTCATRPSTWRSSSTAWRRRTTSTPATARIAGWRAARSRGWCRPRRLGTPGAGPKPPTSPTACAPTPTPSRPGSSVSRRTSWWATISTRRGSSGHWAAVRTGASDGVLELGRGLMLGTFLLRFTGHPPDD